MLEIFDKAEINKEDLHSLVDLLILTWPPDPPKTRSNMIKKWHNRRGAFDQTFIIRSEDRVIAHTNIFSTTIEADKKEMDILALSGVCVHPEYRGKGYGKMMVEKAFELIDPGEFECSIFQTDIPEFYQSLGAKQIHNQFINSSHPTNPENSPFRDYHVMIYPRNYRLGSGIIDLKREGY